MESEKAAPAPKVEQEAAKEGARGYMEMIVLTPQMMKILSEGGWLWVYGKTIRLGPDGVEEWTDGVWGPVRPPPSAPIGASGVDLSLDILPGTGVEYAGHREDRATLGSDPSAR